MIGVRSYMKKEINLFKAGIIWALFSSLIMLIGALINGEFPQRLEDLANKSIFSLIIASILYIIANVIIFTIPALLVYKAAGILSNTEKYVWNSTNTTFLINIGFFLKRVLILIKSFFLTALFYLLIYMIGAFLRGDIFSPNGTKITDYGYTIGVIITALFFGFRDLRDVENTQQKHEDELKKLKKSYSALEAKHKKVEKRYTLIRNKGKQELAKLEKDFQLEDSHNVKSI